MLLDAVSKCIVNYWEQHLKKYIVYSLIIIYFLRKDTQIINSECEGLNVLNLLLVLHMIVLAQIHCMVLIIIVTSVPSCLSMCCKDTEYHGVHLSCHHIKLFIITQILMK